MNSLLNSDTITEKFRLIFGKIATCVRYLTHSVDGYSEWYDGTMLPVEHRGGEGDKVHHVCLDLSEKTASGVIDLSVSLVLPKRQHWH